MRVLILGCDGYIGQHLVEEFHSRQTLVGGFDLKLQKQTTKDLQFFKLGNIANFETLKDALVEFDPEIIIDLAANANVGDQFTIEDYSDNFCSPQVILKVLKKNTELSLRRIIFTSTQYVIGPEHSGNYNYGYAPHTVYGISKVLLEQNIFAIQEEFLNRNIDFFIVRPTNVWGGRHPKYSGIWERLLQKKLVMIPLKRVVKCYCHISTLCELYIKLSNLPSTAFCKDHCVVYGTDQPLSQSEWIQLQVNGLKHVNLKAGFTQVPTWLLFILSGILTIICKVLNRDNPLPWSRVVSMTYDYFVPNNSNKNLSFEKSKEELFRVVTEDVKNRYE